MMHTYEVGDRVIVSDRLVGNSEVPGGLYIAQKMLDYMGREVTIDMIMPSTIDTRYRIKEDDGCYVWSNSCFSGVAKEKQYEIEDIGMLFAME